MHRQEKGEEAATFVPSPQFVEVAVNLPIHGTFTYDVPPVLRSSLAVGTRVLVPFGHRTLTAFVVKYPAAAPQGFTPKAIQKVRDPEPVLSSELLELCGWISHYYFAPLGECLTLAVPKGMDARSVETARITEKGRQALPLVADPLGKLLLSELNQKNKPVRAATLEKKFKSSALLKKYAREGLLTLDQELQEGGVTKRTERFYHLTMDFDEAVARSGRSAPKREKLLRFLSGGERSATEIRAAFPNPSGTLNPLMEKGLVSLAERIRYRSPLGPGFSLDSRREEEKALTPGQAAAFQEIMEGVAAGTFHSYLLHGVTGSGKTEIYLQAISKVIGQGKQAIFLVPEISLTPQMISRIQARFGSRVALLHSGLSQGERYDEWRRIRKGEVDIAVGARSAVFAPFSKLGIIIVDEEHETSFKQEESPKYHARETALVRGKNCGAVVILGSATPSLESMLNAQSGKHRYLLLKDRISTHPMPRMEMVDMRLPGQGGKGGVLSETLRKAVREALERKEQVFLFLNRRGTSHFLQCRECGQLLTCPHCSVTLTYHGRVREMRCHYCNYFTAAPDLCPSCGGHKIFFMGTGTQKLEEEVKDFFPGARVARMDRDAVRTKGSFFRIFNLLNQREIDILIGTQMIAKGHDFPFVTLVGIVNADASLNIPDFRSGERTFQLVAQVAGRAGRAGLPGRVLTQSYNPDHYVFRFLLNHDFSGFCSKEGEMRRSLGYPPYARLAVLTFEGMDDDKTQRAARETARRLQSHSPEEAEVEILGPSEAMIHKVKDTYRWRLLLKGRDYKKFRRFLKRTFDVMTQGEDRGKGLRISMDVDPVTIG